MGPDIAHADAATTRDDPLLRADAAAGRSDAARLARGGGATTIGAMETVGDALMRSIARGLGLPEDDLRRRISTAASRRCA